MIGSFSVRNALVRFLSQSPDNNKRRSEHNKEKERFEAFGGAVLKACFPCHAAINDSDLVFTRYAL